MKQIIKRSNFIICILISLMTGCHMTPRVDSHPLVLPQKMRSGTPIKANAKTLSYVEWWKKMQDPILNQLILEGLARNNSLKAANANVRQAQSQLQEARYAWLPTINANGNGFIGGGWDTNFTPQGALAKSNFISNRPALNFHGYFTGFVPRYSLNIMGNTQNGNYYKASLDMQLANRQSTILSIISQISGAYFMLVGEKQQLIEEKIYLKDLRELRRLEWQRFRAGGADLTTITSLDQQISAYKANVRQLQDSISQVENSIQTLIDKNPAPITSHAKLSSLATHNIIPSTLPANVLANRPDVLVALYNVKMSQANIGVAYANLFPSISLSDWFGRSSFDLRHLLSLSTSLWLAQGSINLPALDAVSWEKIKEAKSGYLATYYNYLQTLRNALVDVDNNLTTYQHNREAYQDKVEVLVAAKKAYMLSQSRYNSGYKDYRETLNAKLTVDTAQLNVTLAKMQQLDSIVGVYQAVAAGVCVKDLRTTRLN